MYFDPGFGSLIIQVVVAGLAAVGACWAIMKGKVKGLFGKKNVAEDEEATEEETTSEEVVNEARDVNKEV
ncbi:MAG TPA: hypothetical protein PLQ04_05280 [Lachnospiraceae bacterium]|nr:hypothetical protein [Lachnospiraceae bacterium]